MAAASTPNTQAFNVGDTLSLNGAQKGGRTLPSTSFTVTSTSTVQDLLTFYQQNLGIDTSPTGDPSLPTPGATLQPDPANAANVQIAITGNEGNDNKLELPGSAFVNQNAQAPLAFNDGTNAAGVASDPSGESVHTPFLAYDSLGNPIQVEVTATLQSKSNAGNVWKFFATSRDNLSGKGPVIGEGTLTFDANGGLKAVTGNAVTIDRTGTGAHTPMSIALDFSGMTELSSQGSALALSNQDGMSPGSLASFSIGTDGIITGTYSNGLTRSLGQVAVASFANQNGLNNIGGNLYNQGSNSGTAVITAPQQLGTGSVRSGALELSNVDLSKEFTNLIIASTGFSASSRVISTSDQLIQDLLNNTH